MTPTFYRGQLVPAGELRVHECKIRYTPGKMAVPLVIFVDEAGLLWNISRAMFDNELKPVEWPTNIRANYVLGHPGGSCPITADSFEDAVAVARANGRIPPWVQGKNIKLLRVCEPQDFEKENREK